MDYRRWYDDTGFLYAYDLEDAQGDTVLQIDSAQPGEVIGEGGRKSKKPVISFAGMNKKLALNKTNGKAIAKMYGKDATKWAGKYVALFVTQADYGGETRDCIRIRPRQPDTPKAATQRNAKGSNGAKKPPAAHYLISRYQNCADEAELAMLKEYRTQAWPKLSADEREAVLAAVREAGERISAGVAEPQQTATEQPELSADEQAGIEAEEAAQS